MAEHLPASADDVAKASAQEPSTRAEPTTPRTGSGINRRDLVLVVVVVVAAAVVTFALLFARGGPSANVSAATAATPPRPPAPAQPSPSLVLHKRSTGHRAYC